MDGKATTNSFNLGGDGDDLEIVLGVEKAFSTQLSDDEAKGCITFGDLYDLVASKLNISEGTKAGYVSTLAYFRLRSALRKIGYGGELSPSTDLRPFLRDQGARKIWTSLEAQLGLTIPELQNSRIVAVGIGLVLITGLAGAALYKSFLTAVLAVCLAIALSKIMPKTSLPKRYSTLGSLAACIAIMNFGKLARLQGGAKAAELWNALIVVVTECAGTEPDTPIRRATTFFKKGRRKTHQ
ncbi:MAG: acyl carrier protein [Rhodoblastus sp.]|mgnify:CR=1 FL=1|nr:acyl carrier protein [Nitratireductor sp.]MCB1524942.1 acyl carrier protein [Rhodoblastus sp.]MCB9998035.1 acyl carrier protein [Methylobacteriaceae bacterium]